MISVRPDTVGPALGFDELAGVEFQRDGVDVLKHFGARFTRHILQADVQVCAAGASRRVSPFASTERNSSRTTFGVRSECEAGRAIRRPYFGRVRKSYPRLIPLATVDREDLAGDVRRVRRHQERDGVADFIGAAPAAQRDFVRDRLDRASEDHNCWLHP
jgi:hypothetical protein